MGKTVWLAPPAFIDQASARLAEWEHAALDGGEVPVAERIALARLLIRVRNGQGSACRAVTAYAQGEIGWDDLLGLVDA